MAGWWRFDNDPSKNIIIFGVDNSLSFHSGNRKDNFLILGEGLTFWINGSFVSPEKKFSINFTKTQNFAWVYIKMLIIVIYLLMEKKSINLKPTLKIWTFQLNFISEVYLMDLVILSQ